MPSRRGRRRSSSCWADRSCSPPTSTTCSPAGRSRRPTVRGLRHARGRHRHGPGVRAGVQRARPTATRSGAQPGFFAWVDGAAGGGIPRPASGRPPREVPATLGADRGTAARPGRVDRSDRVLTGELRRPGHRAARRIGRPGRRAGRAGREPVLRRQHRRHRPDGRRGPRPGAGRRARGPPLPAARRVPVRRPFLDGTTVADLPRPVEVLPTDGVALRRALEVGGLTGRAAHRRHRRAAERRQVHAAQPHPRAPRGDRRGEARRHPRPQGRSTPSGRTPVPPRRHRRLDARRLRPRRARSAARASRPSPAPTP